MLVFVNRDKAILMSVEVRATLRHCLGFFKNFTSHGIKALNIDHILRKVKNIHINMLTATKSLG
jgi:hypothetical protein